MIVKLVEKSASPTLASDQSSMKPNTQIKLPAIKISIAPVALAKECALSQRESDESSPSPSSNMVRENIGGIEVWFNPETQKFYDLEMAFLGHINHDRQTIWK